MPTYEYKCNACGHAFERFQPMTAEPIKRCPQCGKAKVKRLLGIGAGLIFKGSGFYTTDYRSESYKSDAKADSGGGAPSEASGGDSKPAESKSDAKSETKSESKASSKGDAAPPKASSAPAKPESKPAKKGERK